LEERPQAGKKKKGEGRGIRTKRFLISSDAGRSSRGKKKKGQSSRHPELTSPQLLSTSGDNRLGKKSKKRGREGAHRSRGGSINLCFSAWPVREKGEGKVPSVRASPGPLDRWEKKGKKRR